MVTSSRRTAFSRLTPSVAAGCLGSADGSGSAAIGAAYTRRFPNCVQLQDSFGRADVVVACDSILALAESRSVDRAANTLPLKTCATAQMGMRDLLGIVIGRHATEG